MRVLYSYYYRNYVRMGFSSKGAKSFAPGATLTAYLWVIGWLTGLARYTFNLAFHDSTVDPIFDELRYFFLVVIWILVSYSYLVRKHVDIIHEFDDTPVPEVLKFIVLFLFFCIPSFVISIGLSKSSFLLSTCVISFIYFAFYLGYFRRVLKRSF